LTRPSVEARAAIDGRVKPSHDEKSGMRLIAYGVRPGDDEPDTVMVTWSGFRGWGA
jgi:hypothetical protein